MTGIRSAWVLAAARVTLSGGENYLAIRAGEDEKAGKRRCRCGGVDGGGERVKGGER